MSNTVLRTTLTFLILFLLASLPTLAHAQSVYEQDVRFAVDELPKYCGQFFELKKIDWPAISKQFLEEAKAVKTDQEHMVLLQRLLARLKDGHAAVQTTEKTKNVRWPEDGQGPKTGPGLFLCKINDGIYVKNSFATAQGAGVTPGMQVLAIDDLPTNQWIEKKTAERCDTIGHSTDNQAFFHTTHWGLAAPVGYQYKLQLKDLAGQTVTKTVRCQRATYIPWGPAFFPPGMRGDGNLAYAKLPSGFGYIHIRRCPGNLPELIDKALADLGNVPGLILDFRANGGGGFDHDAFMGRFIPAGKTLQFTKRYASAGPNPYGGPIVVIVDGVTRSAGETASGIFKEDGRAYMIGESPTAGTSSSKRTLQLPSGLFNLYFSVASNMKRFNNGQGIEGVGIPPHQIVQYTPKDLAAGIDTLTRRAEELLKNYPQDKVPYNPEKFGWSAN
jgi:C-terminal processing protease CtpA/Prc